MYLSRTYTYSHIVYFIAFLEGTFIYNFPFDDIQLHLYDVTRGAIICASCYHIVLPL